MVRFALMAASLGAFATAADLQANERTNLVRELLIEARGLCAADCNLAEFGALQARIGDLETSKKSFAAAWDSALKLGDQGEQEAALMGIAELQSQSGQIREALEAASSIPRPEAKAVILGIIADGAAETGEDYHEALRIVEMIPAEEAWQRNTTLTSIAMHCSSRRDFAGATYVLNRIPVDNRRVNEIIARGISLEKLDAEEQAIIDVAAARAAATERSERANWLRPLRVGSKLAAGQMSWPKPKRPQFNSELAIAMGPRRATARHWPPLVGIRKKPM